MGASICWNRSRETMTSAIWNVIERPCRTIFAPILTSRSRNVVIDQWQTASGKVRVRTVLFNWNDTDALMDMLREDVRATGLKPQQDRQYWVLDVAGPDAPRSSKRILPGSAALDALRARGEFNDF